MRDKHGKAVMKVMAGAVEEKPDALAGTKICEKVIDYSQTYSYTAVWYHCFFLGRATLKHIMGHRTTMAHRTARAQQNGNSIAFMCPIKALFK